MIVSVVQVSVALYVFYLSWPSSSADKRHLAAAILVFIPGILKCFVKPWSVKSSSFSSLLREASRSPSLRRDSREVISSIDQQTEAYVQAARGFVLGANHPPLAEDEQILHHSYSERLETLFRALCVDHTCPHADRLAILKSFWFLDTKGEQHSSAAVDSGLFRIYNLFYTKHDSASRYTQILNVALPLAAICLFHVSLHGASSSYHYSPQDVKLGMLRFLGFDLYLSYMLLPIPASRDMNKLVCDHLRYGWEHCIKDAESYSRFNDSCGESTLEREGCEGLLRRWISGSRPFDERILIWHLATDLCFHSMTAAVTPSNSNNEHCRAAALSRVISDYMVHLLFTNPEMLMIGSRKEIFMVAYQELENMFQDGYKQNWNDDAQLAGAILASSKVEQGLVWDARELAKTLMEMNDGDKRWKVIQGVWVEMLCFSAGRCRGYLHAKNSGVEYLSQVWILLAYAGMEMLPDRLQRTSKFQGSLQQESTTEAMDGGIAPSTSLQGEGTAAATGIKIVVSP
ncbi:hypothetical protein C2845_PM13G02890 [Panicum miliaceum]|uniref:DUF4220 domain-containing protein n=1 Tax=Panicum miliaceum TaxID=4540 RepID=A0A3L6RIA3_PANMI|nr:hypothetical protein C2845_PM13G02890 [Panicum miliaceum]